MENYDLTQTPEEEQEPKEFDTMSVQEALLALMPKAMEAEF
jgi:hypothetical protein